MAALFRIALVLSALAAITNQIAITDVSIDIGVNYGRLGNNLPPPATVVQLCQHYGIGKVRLYDPDPTVLEAFKGSQIDLTLGIKNEDLPNMGTDPEAVNSWFATYVEPYLQDISFSYIVVGNEVISGQYANYVLPVMGSVRNILVNLSLAGIKVTSAVPSTVLGTSFPPSQGAFSEESKQIMVDILNFLLSQSAPLLINVYPYFPYAAEPEHIQLDYAQFTATGPVVQDGNLSYSNLLDAMVDAFFSAMEQVGINDVSLVISESGWPSDGNGNFTTPSLAATYNQNFMRHVLSRAGTPKRPGSYIEGFIFALFNENLKPTGVEQHFGLFYPNLQPVYNLFPLK